MITYISKIKLARENIFWSKLAVVGFFWEGSQCLYIDDFSSSYTKLRNFLVNFKLANRKHEVHVILCKPNVIKKINKIYKN